MQINLIELWHSMAFPVKCVVLLLTIQAICCIAVVIDRLILLQNSTTRARQFAAAVQGAMQAGAYKSVIAEVANYKPNHLSAYLEIGLRTFITRTEAGDDPQRAAEFTRRALERKGDAVSRDMNRGMNILASTGSTAPFVGLLGTVLGILNAFKMIAATGSGGIGTIGGAIGEALYVTGYGLTVAIPSVLVFNFLSTKLATYEAGLLNAGSELVDRLETSVVARPVVSQPAPAHAHAPSAPAPSPSMPPPRMAPPARMR
jgi:biopolymer transport protein ExbB/TolQ